MPPADSAIPLGRLVRDVGSSVRLLGDEDAAGARPVDRVALWLGAEQAQDGAHTLLVCPPSTKARASWSTLGRATVKSPARMLVVWAGDEPEQARASGHDVIEAAEGVDPAALTAALVRAVAGDDDNSSRRLASLQRSLTLALADPDPLAALARRLSKLCSAAVAVLGMDGVPVHASDPLPCAQLYEEIARADVDTQPFAVQGWRGVAVKVADPAVEGMSFGWLLAASRRDGFPDAYTRSAVQVGAALVETSLRISQLAQQQDKAVRSTLLENAITLPVVHDDPELAGRILGLGLNFDDEMRVVVIQPQRLRARAPQPLDSLAELVSDLLARAGIANLMTARDNGVAALVQGSPEALRRILATWPASAPAIHAGIGRRVRAVGDVMGSYQDARLAIQTQRHRPSEAWVVSYDDFDVATRLFAEVGLQGMTAWADEFLAPLDDRTVLAEGLDTFFEFDQNINAAANALNIHHNSLRYRLAKVEEALELSLRDPAAVASLYLALTAQQLSRGRERLSLAPNERRKARAETVGDIDAPSSATRGVQTNELPISGVARGPEA